MELNGPQGEILIELRRGLSILAGLGVEGLGAAQLGEYQRQVRGLVDQAELLGARALAAFDQIHGHAGTGAADVIGWLSNECRLSPESAMDRVLLARQLDGLESTVSALAIGDLSYEHAAVVARSTARVRPEDAPGVEARLLETAGRMNPGRLRQHAATVVAEIDGEVLRRDAARARERRQLKIGADVDGSATISGSLTSECAAYLRAGLEPWLRPAGAHDLRTATQRRHDALLQVARQAVLGSGTTGNARRPQLVVVAPLSAMEGQDGPPALLQGLVPISQEQLDLVICEADLSVVLKDSAGNIAFAGRRARLFSDAKRRAMLTINPTCAFEGCSWPAISSDSHHVDEYASGGSTTVNEGAPGCFVHHSMVHLEGWALVPNGDGKFRTLPPGHPDNPKSKASGDEYLRQRRQAIFKRVAARRLKSRQNARRKAPEPVGRSPHDPGG
jgi:hypothetical protein